MVDTKDHRAALQQAQNLVQGKGIMGWLTRLFMGKSTTASMANSLNQAEGYLNQADMQQRIMATGVPAKATVRTIADTGTLINFNPVVDLQLDVTPQTGQPFQVQLRTPVSKIAIPRVGDTINVKYNPQNTQEMAIV
jgi:hypothetical protein